MIDTTAQEPIIAGLLEAANLLQEVRFDLKDQTPGGGGRQRLPTDSRPPFLQASGSKVWLVCKASERVVIDQASFPSLSGASHRAAAASAPATAIRGMGVV